VVGKGIAQESIGLLVKFLNEIMNREIKFRAWDFRHKKMFGVDALYQNQVDYIDDKLTEFSAFKPCYGYLSRDEVVVMQFTGLKDKNGKEIYEGDIILSHKEYNSYSGLNSTIYAGNKYQIKNNGWRFYLEPSSLYRVDMEEIEVIGNIYENPELINE
jgi:uncharacterized phage protein (TIGR01671 family)